MVERRAVDDGHQVLVRDGRAVEADALPGEGEALGEGGHARQHLAEGRSEADVVLEDEQQARRAAAARLRLAQQLAQQQQVREGAAEAAAPSPLGPA